MEVFSYECIVFRILKIHNLKLKIYFIVPFVLFDPLVPRPLPHVDSPRASRRSASLGSAAVFRALRNRLRQFWQCVDRAVAE